jgi:hypothetical protein
VPSAAPSAASAPGGHHRRAGTSRDRSGGSGAASASQNRSSPAARPARHAVVAAKAERSSSGPGYRWRGTVGHYSCLCRVWSAAGVCNTAGAEPAWMMEDNCMIRKLTKIACSPSPPRGRHTRSPGPSGLGRPPYSPGHADGRAVRRRLPLQRPDLRATAGGQEP